MTVARKLLTLAAVPTLAVLSNIPLEAEEDALNAAPEENEAIAEANPWSYNLRLGAFLNQVATRRAGSSRDSTIASTTEAISYRLSLTGDLTWEEGPNELRQELRLRYGRSKEADRSWITNRDEIRYDITGFRFLDEPRIQFAYVSGRAQTVFEGPDDNPNRGNRNLDPGSAFIAIGYGQRHKDIWLPESDRVEARVGVRAQRRWGRDLSSDETEVDIGIEAIFDYRNQLREDIEWSFYAESFAPFDDLGHITTWAELSLDFQINTWVTANMGVRIYYETDPKDADRFPGDGYNSMSIRQEALIGITYTL
ncbi:MAG: DUF481 domain-containing protein [Planctomycetota bacterium]|nr:MAG: DUF481 domain-containing protein [Planctomycetota bacterium]